MLPIDYLEAGAYHGYKYVCYHQVGEYMRHDGTRSPKTTKYAKMVLIRTIREMIQATLRELEWGIQ